MEIYKKISAGIINNSVNCSAWLVDIRDFAKYIDEIRSCLSQQELKKYEVIKVLKQKELYCLRKGVTRIILSRLFDTYPYDLQYAYGNNGKPFIENIKNIQFNISHSKEYLLVGTADQIDIGVDIERINSSLDYSLVAKSIMSAEEQSVFNTYDASQQLRSFYKTWVQKEAISKALGLGLALGFNSFSVSIDPKYNKEEYNLQISNRNACVKLSVFLENDYAMCMVLVEKE